MADYVNNYRDLMDFIEKREERAEVQRSNYQIDQGTSRKWIFWKRGSDDAYQVTKPTYADVYRCSCPDFQYREEEIREKSKLMSQEKLDKKVECKHIKMLKNELN